MSTHATIGILRPDQSIDFIYHHSDGYVHGGVGQALHDFYPTQADATGLINMGADAFGRQIRSRIADFNNQPHSDDHPFPTPPISHATNLRRYFNVSIDLHVHQIYLWAERWNTLSRLPNNSIVITPVADLLDREQPPS